MALHLVVPQPHVVVAMRMIIAGVSLALLIWAPAVSAQSTFTATVSVHRELRLLSSDEVNTIMDKASHALEKIPGGQACPVKFELKGPVGTFGSAQTPAVIKTEAQRDAVHRVDLNERASFHIKVVKAIEFCVGESSFNGCAWPVKYPSIIVVHPDVPKRDEKTGQLVSDYPDHLLWVHEFAHLTGKSHRPDPGRTLLMTGCVLTAHNNKVSEKECSCLLLGFRGCGKPTPLACER